MRTLIVGGAGTVGRKIVDHFVKDHEVIVAGRTSGQVTVDLTSADSIKRLLDDNGMV
ncbi:MAG: nucleoside-diphosphate-sugar epimerase [Saprospiraceae bacterium]|jgi:nucleoside-diphosphate-sugar epimerase|tara:strand:+ start:205 stop:375 length:171 start_codon:yes stop_codon:yes gene_type:complete